MHHYCSIRDTKLFANEATEKFMGKTMTSAILEGNPFVWALNDWQLPEDFQVCSDFPGLKVWEANMTAEMMKLCFQHEKVKSNLEILRFRNKQKDGNSEEKYDVEVDINENEIDNQEVPSALEIKRGHDTDQRAVS